MTSRIVITRQLEMEFVKAARDVGNCLGWALGRPELNIQAGANGKNDLSDAAASSHENLRKALVGDGFVYEPIRATPFDPSKEHIFAARLNPGHDYHFLRLDRTRTWSHRDGLSSFASNVDDKGAVIENPVHAEFKGFFVFAGYFSVPEKPLILRPRPILRPF